MADDAAGKDSVKLGRRVLRASCMGGNIVNIEIGRGDYVGTMYGLLQEQVVAVSSAASLVFVLRSRRPRWQTGPFMAPRWPRRPLLAGQELMS